MKETGKLSKGKKAANGEGTIYKRPNGTYQTQVTIGRKADGTPKRLSITGKTRREVASKKAEIITERDRGILAEPDAVTVKEYADRWLARHGTLSERSRTMYRQELAFALDHIGDLRVQEVKPATIKDLMAALASHKVASPGREGQLLAPRTLGKILMRLKSLFREAVNDQIIYRSPAESVRRPKEPSREAIGRTLDFDEAARFIEIGRALLAAGLCRLFPALYTCLSLGLRRGELLGLRWQDVDLESGVLRIRSNLIVQGNKAVLNPFLKTDHARRDLFMPASLTACLTKHKERQEKERAKAGDAWAATGAVFATELGTFTHPRNLNRARDAVVGWSDKEHLAPKHLKGVGKNHRAWLLQAVGEGKRLPAIRTHDLRHTYATLAIRKGVPVDIVSRNLGHARISITLDIYRHVLDIERRQASAVELFDNRESPPLVEAQAIA